MHVFYNLPFYVDYSLYSNWVLSNFASDIDSGTLFATWLFFNFLYFLMRYMIIKIVKYFATFMFRMWY